ncbi:hypothetical protein BB561_006702 [Smittium simulii]|uniref:Uncharacterized protein n=1 Tax=Smittium simulii TaxID=133385 RepID=A0A2T9Y291_9FUNG|nr:hypothetical protein BB561_006702 [Smittium simulii]
MNKRDKKAKNTQSQDCFNIFNSFQELIEIDSNLLLNVNQLKNKNIMLRYCSQPSIMSIGTLEESLYKDERNINNYLDTDSGILRLGLKDSRFEHMNPLTSDSKLGFYYNHYYNHDIQNENAGICEYPLRSAQADLLQTKFTSQYSSYYELDSHDYCKNFQRDDIIKHAFYNPETDTAHSVLDNLHHDFVQGKNLSLNSNSFADMENPTNQNLHEPEFIDYTFTEIENKNSLCSNNDLVPGLIISNSIPKIQELYGVKDDFKINTIKTVDDKQNLQSETKFDDNTFNSIYFNNTEKKNFNNAESHKKFRKKDIKNKPLSHHQAKKTFDSTLISKKNKQAYIKSVSENKRSHLMKINTIPKYIFKKKLNLRINTLDYKLIKLFSDNKCRTLFENNKNNIQGCKVNSKSLDFLYLNSFEYFNNECESLERATFNVKDNYHSKPENINLNLLGILNNKAPKSIVLNKKPNIPTCSSNDSCEMNSISLSNSFGNNGGYFNSNKNMKSLFSDDNLIYFIPEKMKMKIIGNIVGNIKKVKLSTSYAISPEIFRFYSNSVDSFFTIIKIDMDSKHNPENKLSIKDSTKSFPTLLENKKSLPNISIGIPNSKKQRKTSLKSELEFVYIQTEAANEAAKYNIGTTKLYIHNKDISSNSNKKIIKSRITSIPSQIREIPDFDNHENTTVN